MKAIVLILGCVCFLLTACDGSSQYDKGYADGVEASNVTQREDQPSLGSYEEIGKGYKNGNMYKQDKELYEILRREEFRDPEDFESSRGQYER